MNRRVKAVFSLFIVVLMVSGMTFSLAEDENNEKGDMPTDLLTEPYADEVSDETGKAAESEGKAIYPFDLALEGREGIDVITAERFQRFTDLAKEVEEVYLIKSRNKICGYLTYDAYSFKNGDLYYYLKYEARGDNGKDIDIILPFMPEKFDLRTIEYPEGFDETTSQMRYYKGQSAEDNVLKDLAPNSVYIDSEKLSLYLSYTSVYTKRPYEIRDEVYEMARGVSVSPEGIKVSLPYKAGAFSEQWGIISCEKLVDWNSRAVSDAVRVADLNRVRKWGGDGTYYKMPVGYSPYYKNGFYRNSANHIGNKFIMTDGRFFEDFGYITMDALLKTQNYYGYWSTTPRSDWLYGDYKIGPGFFDTRWDTEGALSLLRAYRRFNEPMALEGAIEFADFYCEFAAANSYKTKNNGILVYDYGFTAQDNIKTHVSLNHLLNEMNFLYEMYITTGRNNYLKTAERILVAVRDTQKSWIKSNGDLHYAYMPNGSYGRQDYPTLTYNDLKYSQSLIKQIYGKEDAAIAKLITSKEKYLKKNNITY